MRTLISGGAGFIGLHVGRALAARGHRVTLLDNFARGVADAELEEFAHSGHGEVVSGDLLRPGTLEGLGEGYDYVVHLAALLGVENVRRRPYEVLSLNHAMLESMIAFARRQKGLRRLLFASTSEVYGGTLRYFGMPIPTPESTPLAVNDLAEPRTSYMLSKIHGEALCRYSGLPVSIIRIHNAYGPRMGISHVIPELLKKAHMLAPGAKLEVFSARHRRTFCFVADVVEFVARILESPACEGEALNVGRQEPEIEMGELGAMVLRTVGREAEIMELPETPGSPPRRAPDMARTAALTGYQAQVDMACGLAQTYDWYRARVFDGGGASAL